MNKKKRSLERLDNEKFKLSQDKLCSISGGKMMEDSIDSSYEYSWTNLESGSVMDAKHYDACMDW